MEAEMLQRPKPGEILGPSDAPFTDSKFAKEFPMLHAMLKETRYDDGNPRVSSTILFFCENGVLRACLNDRDNNRSAFFTDEQFLTLLEVMENGLTSGRVDWRSKRDAARTPF
jgi:HKD family nuclease